MNNNQPSNTLSIIGIVLGAFALVFSFFPCLGMFAIIPGIIGAIIGLIAFLKAKDNGHPQTLSIIALVVSVLACGISIFQIFALGSMANDMKLESKEYTNCEDLTKDYEAFKIEMKTIAEELEDSPSFGAITKMGKMGFRIENFKVESEKLGCNIDIDELGEDLEKMETSNEEAEEGTEQEEPVQENTEQEEGQ